MREMVLNPASLEAGDVEATTEFLKGAALGMSRLVLEGVAGYPLQADRQLHEIHCATGVSLSEAMQRLRGSGACEEFGFLVRLATKAPLLDGVDPEAEYRFHTCEATSFSPEDGAPLLLCALTRSIVVGFPTSGEWDRDRLTVDFDELLPSGNFGRESEDIDHLARPDHAVRICDSHRRSLRAGLSAGEFWSNRRAAFPDLVFSPDVEDHIRKIERFDIVVEKLTELNDDAGERRRSGGSMPRRTRKVVNESESLRTNRRLTAHRRFGSHSGGQKLFLWHARFGRGWRIHLRFDAEKREVEIGYIGPHLPL